jgi:hypothetical protein
MRWGLAILIFVCLPNVVGAQTLVSSIRPMPRPNLDSPNLDRPILNSPSLDEITILRPRARPNATSQVGMHSPRPAPRPALTAQPKKQSLQGAVCDNSAIRGHVIAPVKSAVKGCGIAQPVRVTEISGVRLRPAATLNCDTAAALETWIKTSVRPAFGARQVVQMQIAASYVCRGRNNVKGARISEHGRGNAIDIAGFTLADGTSLSVEKQYNKTLRKIYKGACGIFGTTLGPGSDGHHEDHIHLDIARHRSGSYCR